MIKRKRIDNYFTLLTGVIMTLLSSTASVKIVADTTQPSSSHQKLVISDESTHQAIDKPTIKLDHMQEKTQLKQQNIEKKAIETHSEVTIDINSASIAELREMTGIGQEKASKIVEYREKNGRFKTIDELEKVPGIGKKTIEKNRQWIAVE